MNAASHDNQLLGAYVLGTLDPQEISGMETHLADCPACRDELEELQAIQESLGELPPEALLDGPPQGGELALQRTLRQADEERTSQRRQRWLRMAGAAVLVGVLLVGGGAAAGYVLTGGASPSGPDATELPELASGSIVASNEDPQTGAQATVRLQPAVASAEVQVDTVITGIPAGEECEVVVLSDDGTGEVAATWTVSPEAAAGSSKPSGVTSIAKEDIASVVVRNVEDTEFVAVPF
ncbi:anti-sigma factor family protein [Salinactinospora qingdaonensis]|uniref:Zf-HC2 domain-containing protein n=1 Tax=Salinactinospora qingdaonensis TaxID=702744 RepID=A0ABP7F6D4_9ACTN